MALPLGHIIYNHIINQHIFIYVHLCICVEDSINRVNYFSNLQNDTMSYKVLLYYSFYIVLCTQYTIHYGEQYCTV